MQAPKEVRQAFQIHRAGVRIGRDDLTDSELAAFRALLREAVGMPLHHCSREIAPSLVVSVRTTEH